MFSSVDFFNGHQDALLLVAIVPAVLLLVVLVLPQVLRHPATQRFGRLQAIATQVRGALTRVREGLKVFRNPRLGAIAAVMQLTAWGLQALSCYMLLIALGLSHQTGFAAAAAVLFAVNVTAVIPATPANLGVFQAACVAVLHTGWHVGFAAGVRVWRDPSGGRGGDGDRDGDAGAAEGRHVVARGQDARDARHPGQAAGAVDLAFLRPRRPSEELIDRKRGSTNPGSR